MRITAYCVAASFLCIHIVLLILFYTFGVTPMVYFNICSIVFYIITFFLIKFNFLRAFVVLTYFEVVAHMTTATYFVGWESGFQITLIGMNILAFVAEYFGRCTQRRYVPAIPLGIVGMCAFLIAFMLDAVHTPQYPLPPNVAYILMIAWGIVTFTISGACLEVFVLASFKSEKSLSTQASHDTLTGLPNRNYMSEYLKDTAEEEGLESRWLAIADIDDFKVINDTYGHNCGDSVLKTIAEILTECATDSVVCRWGGEEFVLVGKTPKNEDEVFASLERIRVAVEEHSFWHDELRFNITITLGAARYQEGESAIEWVNRADKNLYIGKTNGKNQVVI